MVQIAVMRRMVKYAGSPILVTASKTGLGTNFSAITKKNIMKNVIIIILTYYDMQIMFMLVQNISETNSLLFDNYVKQSILLTQHPSYCLIIKTIRAFLSFYHLMV